MAKRRAGRNVRQASRAADSYEGQHWRGAIAIIILLAAIIGVLVTLATVY
ncbi:MAG: hypothetical protein HYW25_01905 [Candidatus Aenigmarchaeota archaeon]|nr:hypothetical protein [Candidatus Aenigmarchaeota archaeon]